MFLWSIRKLYDLKIVSTMAIAIEPKRNGRADCDIQKLLLLHLHKISPPQCSLLWTLAPKYTILFFKHPYSYKIFTELHLQIPTNGQISICENSAKKIPSKTLFFGTLYRLSEANTKISFMPISWVICQRCALSRTLNFINWFLEAFLFI